MLSTRFILVATLSLCRKNVTIVQICPSFQYIPHLDQLPLTVLTQLNLKANQQLLSYSHLFRGFSKLITKIRTDIEAKKRNIVCNMTSGWPHVEVQGEEVDDQDVLFLRIELKGDKINAPFHYMVWVLVCLVLCAFHAKVESIDPTR